MQEHDYNILLRYLKLVLAKNESLNLTRITDLDQGKLLHIEDSLVALEEIEQAPKGRLIDMGTGGGFPGIPIALATKRHTTLVDSTKKKAHAVESIVAELGIEHVTVCSTRIEEIARKEPASFAVATARALAPLPSLVELASPLLERGGWLVAYKAGSIDVELQAALSIQSKVGMSYLGKRETLLSDGETKRIIVTFEKTEEPSVVLPRRNGAAQSHPYA